MVGQYDLYALEELPFFKICYSKTYTDGVSKKRDLYDRS